MVSFTKFVVVVALLCATVSAATAATVPQILTIGPEEAVGVNGRLSDIATDTMDQPHIVCDGGTFAYMYDKIGGTWRSSSINVAPFRQFYNPALEIDKNNRSWCSGVLVAGLGFIVRDNVNTATPGGPWFSEHLIEPAWDCGNLSIDPNKPDYCVGLSARGHWSEFIHDASVAGGHIRQCDAGAFSIISGGEKNTLKISTAGDVVHAGRAGNHAIWHAAVDTSYQNSFRQALGLPYVEWANWGTYPEIQDDGAYPSVVGDAKDPFTAYMVHGWANTGVKMNIWQGNPDGSGQLLRSSRNLLVVSAGGSGYRRYGVQMAAAKNGGVFLIWQRSGQIIVRYVARDGTMGPETVIGSGSVPNIVTDLKGNLHVVYNNNGVKYRKLTVSGSISATSEAATKAGDFDGDGTDDIATFNASTATWTYQRSCDGTDVSVQFGTPGSLPVPADYNGDGTNDVAVFQPTNSTWYIAGAPAPIAFGSAESNDIPVPADYNGDGAAEIAMFRPSSATWYIRGVPTGIVFGTQGDTPVPADYNGDGTDELALYRKSDSTWYVAGLAAVQFGTNGDLPVVGDYDGDGKADLAVYRTGTGYWYVQGSSGTNLTKQLGVSSDIPVPGNYDGDTKCDLALFRSASAEWFILKSISGFSNLVTGAPVAFGGPGDIAAKGDYDNDGVSDFAIFRPSTATWYPFGSSVGPINPFVFGARGDIPVLADYDGDHTNDIAVFRPSTATWYVWGSKVHGMAFTYGGRGDVPVPADYDGDGKIDVAVFRPSTAAWYYWGSRVRGRSFVYGAPGDVPAPGDYDHDGTNDVAVFRPSTKTWYWWGSSEGPGSRVFGPEYATPVPGDYDSDGVLDFALFEGASWGKWWIRQSEDETLMKGSAPFVFGSPSDIPIGSRRGM
jgi:hypothetical protein